MVAYRTLAVLIWCLWLAVRGVQAGRARLTGRPLPPSERLQPPPARPDGARFLWVHGASNGEMTAARPLVERILARWPQAGLMVTVNNPTARALVAGWGLPRLQVRLAPLDAGPPTRAFLDRIRPDLLVVIENELWPLRLAECARRGIPVVVAGARMSPASARRWARLSPLIRPALAAITWLAPQDEASRDRFAALGLDPARIGPVLSLKAGASGADAPATAPAPERTHTILAASTHEGEEETVLDAFLAARAARPDLRLILAPRHPRRGPDIARLIAARGLQTRTRSNGEPRDARAPVYLADTLGEMALWYAQAGLCFVGGSLTDRGGHTPFEPAAARAAILHGPHTANFAPAYAALAAADAAVPVRDAASLAAAWIRLGGDAAAQARLADCATAALAPFRDEAATADLLDRIAAALATRPAV